MSFENSFIAPQDGDLQRKKQEEGPSIVEAKDVKKRMIKNAVFAIALSMFIHHDTAKTEAESLKEHAVLERMVEKGPVKSSDCEKTFSLEFQSLPFHERSESAFAAIYTKEGMCQIITLGHGGEGGVTTDEGKTESLTKNKELIRIVFYHTHPVQLALDIEKTPSAEVKEIQEGKMPPFELSSPSAEDFMTMAKKEIEKQVASNDQKEEVARLTEERVVTGLGIWRFGIVPGRDPQILYEDSMKLGSLESYYTLNREREPDILKKIDKIKSGYADVAIAYTELKKYSNDYSSEAKDTFRRGEKKQLARELGQKLEMVKRYSKAMEKIGFQVTFDLHSKYQKLLEVK